MGKNSSHGFISSSANPAVDGSEKRDHREEDVIQELPLGLVLVDGQGNIELLNRAAGEFLDPFQYEFLGQSYQAFFREAIRFAEHPREMQQSLNSVLYSLDDQPALELKFRAPLPAVMEWLFFPRRSPAGSPAGWGIMMEDQTARREAAQGRIRMMGELSRQMRRDHAAAAGRLEALERNHRVWDPELVSDFLDDAVNQLNELGLRLDQIMDLITWQDRGVQVYPRTVGLRSLIRGGLRAAIGGRGEQMPRVDLPGGDQEVQVDPAAVHRTLVYLIRAVQERSGEVPVKLSGREAGEWIEISLAWKEDPENDMDLPGPASRGDRDGSLQPALDLGRELIAAHGGWLRYESSGRPVEGQRRIRFQIPKKQEQVQRSIPLINERSARAGEGRILVIEDRAEDQQLLVRLLERAGYRVDLAENGLTALDLIQTRSPDLVVMAWEIPELSGVNLIRTIRRWSRVPVLVLASSPNPGVLVAALEAGADDYLMKPYRLDEFLARLEAVLRRTEERDQQEGEIYQSGDLRIDYGARLVWVRGEQLSLTPIEYTLLATLSRHQNQVLSYQQLIERAWEGPDQGSRQGLFVHISRLREKIERDPENPVLIKNRWGVGYVFNGD